MNILDIIVIAIFIFCLINSFFKGMIKELIDIFGFILGIFIFKILYPFISTWFLKSFFYERVQRWVVIDLHLRELFHSIDIDWNNTFNLEILNLPEAIKEQIVKLNNPEMFDVLNATNSREFLTGFIANLVISLICLFFTIVITSFLVNVILKNIRILRKFPKLKKFDKWGGIVFGVFNAIFTIWLFGLVIIILVLFPQFEKLKEILDASIIAKSIFENNYLIQFLLSLVTNILKNF